MSLSSTSYKQVQCCSNLMTEVARSSKNTGNVLLHSTTIRKRVIFILTAQRT
jgi:hypothetical protein